MKINIIVAIDNEIVKAGLTSIIHDGVLGSNILCVNKKNVIDKLKLNFFDIIIIDIKKDNQYDNQLIKDVVCCENKTKVFVFLQDNLNFKDIKFIEENGIELILGDSSNSTIIKQIKFNIQYYQNRNSLRKRKINRLKSLNILLSVREFEIGTMLINGDSISTIAIKKNLAISTISTYKRRIFEKTNVQNIIQMAKLFNKPQFL